jgi:protein gp37
MATKIQQVQYSWNPFQGCTKISEGCKNCYAEKLHRRLMAMGLKKYEFPFKDIRYWTESLIEPNRIKKPSMIFVNSMSDTFHANRTFVSINAVFSIMSDIDRHIYQIYTKRPSVMLQFFKWKNELAKKMATNNIIRWKPKDNIWFGVSVENQKEAYKRLPDFIKLDASVKFVSAEPLLERIDISLWMVSGYMEPPFNDIINWVIIGCESGPGKRPCKIEWVEYLVKQCKEYNIPLFVKQLNINGKVVKDINLFPEHLRIRQMPENPIMKSFPEK